MYRATIQRLIEHGSLGLLELACAGSGPPSGRLNLPVGVIDARRPKPKLIVSAIGTINSTLRASSTIAHPLMVRLFERFEDVGLEQALIEMKSGEEGEAFAEVWQAYRDERRSGDAPMWSIEDATAFVVQSREAHADREVACVAILPGDPHRIITFSVPIAFLTRD